MKIVSLRGLDNKCNIALNESFDTANKFLCEEATSAHMLMHLLYNDEVAKQFDSDFSEFDITAKDYTHFLTDMLYRNKDNTSANQHITVGIDEISREFQSILSYAVFRAISNQREIDVMTMYRCIIREKGSNAWKVLTLMGVDSSIDVTQSNPLEDMPITSQFAVDYNSLAKNNRFDPIESRDKEIDRVFEVMGRRIKNNPCLVGDAGVGKTAIVEGMAQRLVSGDVPNYLRNKHIISVDVSGIVSGSKYRGDFEEKLNGILNEAASNNNVILFFDEIHMLMEAGGSSADSAMNAANILKPAISRGDVQIIGATTPAEYKKFVEKDKAFERRLQSVDIGEPDVESAIKMAQKVAYKYEEFHKCKIDADALEAAVVLSDRYITDKKLPDKAITVLDETAARLKKNYNRNSKFTVSVADIKSTISKTTGIDVDDLDETSRKKLSTLGNRLQQHVIGQDDAIHAVVKAIRRSKAGIKDPNRPIGSFLFVGPTGVGKTELTKALAIEFSNGIKNMIRFDMSEFMEKHTVSKLIGSPPGYVGYGEGGQLTEAVRHNPYSIILFDEIEKAHPDVFNILLQILDDGILTDSQGLKVDFKNTIIIMTSNAGYGADQFGKKSIGFGTSTDESDTDAGKNEKIAMKALESTFRPEFINRLDKIVIFNKLEKDSIEKIVELLFKQLKGRLSQSDIKLSWDESIIKHIAETGFSEKYGARNIKRKIQEQIEDLIADKIIDEELMPGYTVKVCYTSEVVIRIRKSISKRLEFSKTEVAASDKVTSGDVI